MKMRLRCDDGDAVFFERVDYVKVLPLGQIDDIQITHYIDVYGDMGAEYGHAVALRSNEEICRQVCNSMWDGAFGDDSAGLAVIDVPEMLADSERAFCDLVSNLKPVLARYERGEVNRARVLLQVVRLFAPWGKAKYQHRTEYDD